MSDYLNGLLDRIAGSMPAINRVLQQGEQRLDAYVQSLVPDAEEAYQPHSEVADAAARYCAELLGDELAGVLRDELIRAPIALTANHHGVDFFAQSVQGTLGLSLRQIDRQPARTVPVFACGSIAMNNLTYPRGLLVYQVDGEAPLRIPVFPDRVKRQAVARASPFDTAMLQRSEQRITKLARDGVLTLPLAEALNDVLQNYRDHGLPDPASYSDQAVILNHRLWQRLLPAQGAAQLVYLELERLSLPLIIQDLQDDNSLLSILLFNDQVRGSLIQALQGTKGCWQNADLLKQAYDQQNAGSSVSQGTFMFWGLDPRGRRFPLGLEVRQQQLWLRSMDATVDWRIAATVDALGAALQRGDLLPSLFTCYTVISLARGVVCAGGYYQAEYLPQIQRGVITALNADEQFGVVAKAVAKVSAGAYLSGMQTVMCEVRDGLVPAGLVEMIGGGGLTAQQQQQIASMTVRDAHLASLSETLMDVFSDSSEVCWQRLRKDMKARLRSRVVQVAQD